MNKSLKKTCALLLTMFIFITVACAQEIGANFNHEPEIIDISYLKETPVEWIRTTPYIFEYINGDKDPATSPGLGKLIEVKKEGYKIAFGFRWDFKKFDLNIPEPGSEREKKYFDVAAKILDRVGPDISIFLLGNEPNLETKDEDMQTNDKGYVPLVMFTKRLYSEVVANYYNNHPSLKKPDVYVGSIAAVFLKKFQENAAVSGLIKLAQENKNIKGLSIHLHIKDSSQMDNAFQFVRSMMPSKPIIVPEFSLFKLYNEHVTDELGDTPAGIAFAKKYNYSPHEKTYEWYSHANTDRVSAKEWKDFFDSRKWFPQHFMKTYYRYFKKYGVVLATYGFLSQSAPKNVGPKTGIWFINPIFPGKSLLPQPDGSITPNPLWFDDFTDIVNEGKPTKN